MPGLHPDSIWAKRGGQSGVTSTTRQGSPYTSRSFAATIRPNTQRQGTLRTSEHGGNRLTHILARGYFPHELSWLIDNPLRRLFVSPAELADRLPVHRGSQMLEIGPGSGYFSAIHEHRPDPDFVSFGKLRHMVEANGFVFQRRWGRSWNYTATFSKGGTDKGQPA